MQVLNCYLLKCPKPVPYPNYFKYTPEVKWFVELVSKEQFSRGYQVESGKHYSVAIINKCYRSKTNFGYFNISIYKHIHFQGTAWKWNLRMNHRKNTPMTIRILLQMMVLLDI